MVGKHEYNIQSCGYCVFWYFCPTSAPSLPPFKWFVPLDKFFLNVNLEEKQDPKRSYTQCSLPFEVPY